MPIVQIKTNRSSEATIAKIAYLAAVNKIDATTKPERIELGLDWLMKILDALPPEQIQSILNIKP